jgi:hypothetical protein
MDNKSSSYGGASWADQWDYSDDPNPASRNSKKTGDKQSGMEKTKVIASVGFKKAKEGTSHGIQWIKEKYQKKKSQKK